MQVICSYCRKRLPDKPPFDNPSPTHTMCPECLAHFEPQWKGQSLSEYLNQFDAPVLAVNAEGRLIAANSRATQLLGKPREDLIGRLGGEATECVNARLPGGCGNTVHCQRCTIRRTVTETMTTGKSFSEVQAYVDRDGERVHFLISTEREDDFVRLTVEAGIPASTG